MLKDRILLSPEEIYEKEFKVAARGYRPQEVDNFLDIVIKDYTEFIRIIRGYEKQLKDLNDENNELKTQVRKVTTELEAQKDENDESVSNVDLLRRISQLEKVVYSKLR